MYLSLYAAPASEPLSLDDVKAQLRVESTVTANDSYYDGILIPAARERCEAATGRALITQTWDLVLDRFPSDTDWIELPRAPLKSISYVKYIDENGVQQTWSSANYIVQAPKGERCQRGRIALAYNCSWPSTRYQAGAVEIRFVCGYGTAADVPYLLKAAMLLDIGTLDADRENLVKGRIVQEIPNGSSVVYRRYASLPRQELSC